MKKEEPKTISIIVPVYNTVEFLKESLKSLLIQGVVSYEIIIVNDGSTDGSAKVAKDFANEHSNVIYIDQENKGAGAARNLGISYAGGEYIYFMDSDDILRKNALSSLLTIVKEEKLEAILFDGEAFYSSTNKSESIEFMPPNYTRSKTYGYFSSGELLLSELINKKEFLPSPCLYIVKRSVILNNNLKFIEGYIHEDELYTPTMLLNIKRCMHINRSLFLRRVREESVMTSSNAEKRYKSLTKVLIELDDTYNKHSFISNETKKGFKKIMSEIYETLIYYSYHVDDKIKDPIINKIARKHLYFNGKTFFKKMFYPIIRKEKSQKIINFILRRDI